MTITIADGRGALWQWDTGRRVKITDGDGVKQIHYQNKCFGCSVDVDVGADGTAIIPDELLQDCHTLTAYVYVTDDTGAYTMEQQDFIVHKRAKPAGYVFTPTDQMTLQMIQRQIGDLADLTTGAKTNLVAAINEAARTGGDGGGSTVELDTTLTQSGKAADAKAVGDILATLTLGQHTDGLIYIFIGGKPMGNGLSINGEIVEPVYGDIVVDNAILSITKGQTVQLGVKLSEKPTQDQTVTVLTDSNALTFDKATLNFTPDNWSEFQFVSVTAGDIDEDTTATITLRNSDELLTDTAITVYLVADAYSVDMTIPEGAYTATAADFDSVTVRGTGLSVGVYTGSASNGATNVYVPPTMEYEGQTYTTIIKGATFGNLPDTVEYLHIDKNCVYTSYGVYAEKTTNLSIFGVKGTGLVGLKYAAPTATKGDYKVEGCSALKWVDGLTESVGVDGKISFKNCPAIEYIPDLSGLTKVTSFNQAFWGCTSLKKVYGMPPNLTNLNSAFYNCSALETAEVPSGVTTMFYSFSGNSNLKKVMVYAEGVTNADSAFKECSGTKVYVPAGSTTYTTLNGIYGSSASIELLYLGGGSKLVVSCWGDSTTSTGTDGEAWPTRLQTKLGEIMQVKNMAISGEWCTSTSCRQGGNEASLVSGVTIPAAVEAVAVTLKSKDGQTFGTSPVLSTGANYNPVTIAGVEGSISISGGQAYFTRKTAGDAVAVSAGTAVVSKNAVARKEDAVQVIYLGTNAGWNLDPNILLNQVQSMVEYYGGTNYIIMGPAGGQMVRTEEARAATLAYEELAAEAFGEHWLNLREYLIANSLTENGLTATKKDNERMAVGLIPWSILLSSNTEGGTDDVHYNTHGLQSVCNAVYAKGQTLGYWN